MDTVADTTPQVKKIKSLSQLLVMSLALNVGLAGTLVYKAFSADEKVAPMQLSQRHIEVTNGEMIYSYFHLGFDDLVSKLSDDRLVEDGYSVRDLALACLVTYHHFDLDRALPGIDLQRRHLLFVHTNGGEEVSIPAYPGLTADHYENITRFAKEEKWPLTAKGLFLQLKGGNTDPTLSEAFAHTTPFHLAYTLFSREPLSLEENDVFNLLLEGEWAQLEKIAIEKDFSDAGRRAILGEYLAAGSKKAMKLLGKSDVKRIENEKLLEIIPKSDNVAFLRDLTTSVRPDEVRSAARDRIREIEPVTSPKPVVPTGEHRYTVQKGDTLWQIARNHKIPLKKLLADNNMTDKDALRPGKQLVIKN